MMRRHRARPCHAITATPSWKCSFRAIHFPCWIFLPPTTGSRGIPTTMTLVPAELCFCPVQTGGNPANLLVQAGKEGTIFLAQTSPVGTMGGYTGNGASDSTLQALPHVLCYNTAVECGVIGSGAFWSTTSGGGGSTGYAFFAGANLPLMQFQFYPNGSTCTNTGVVAGFCTTPTASTAFSLRLARAHAHRIVSQHLVSAGDCLGRGYAPSWKQGSRSRVGL